MRNININLKELCKSDNIESDAGHSMDMLGQIYHTVRVSPFVIIPGHYFVEIFV
jgi:hypothetical protein